MHYFALDSAEWWERILGELLPNARFPGAVVRRTVAVKIFADSHIAPLHTGDIRTLFGLILSALLQISYSDVESAAPWGQRKDLPFSKKLRSVGSLLEATLVCPCCISFGQFLEWLQKAAWER